MDFIKQTAQILGSNHQNDIIIDNSLLLVGSGDLARDFVAKNATKYDIKIAPFIKDYSGSLGNFCAKMGESGESNGELGESANKISQIIFFNAPSEVKKPQLGIHFISDYENLDALCDEVSAFIGAFSFEKTIAYDAKKCQFHHRDKTEFSYCADCATVCPTMAISADFEKRELVFSQIDCVLCGKCVGVCPTGAMQKSNATLENLNKALSFYKDKIAVVCENETDFEAFLATCHESSHELPRQKSADFAPLILPSVNMLNEAYLLSIVQESGRICVIVGDESAKIDSHLRECADFVNSLYNRVMGQNAVFLCESPLNQNADSIANIEKSTPLPHYHYSISDGEFSREMLANRIRFLIKDNDFGVLKNSANLIYTNLKIDAQKCTLCMACVESCNTNALISAKDNFAILANPSLCSACGYCVDTCAEKCLEMDFEGYQLNETFLTHRVLAQDEPFYCVECGEIFATKKSIEKVQGILASAFMDDSLKLKSIECCEKCKVKIMFGVAQSSANLQRDAK